MFSRIATLSLILVLSLMAIAAPVEVPSVANEVRDDAPPPDPLTGILAPILGLVPLPPILGGILMEEPTTTMALPENHPTGAPIPKLVPVDTVNEDK
ncbi:hypothetical protein NLI96_g4955 [Meripilus lineatus]|uniref:Uncharacterized protein n=1 Tax=Meripilus lineatus TaxID=2056292 RepID=A0AAD5V5T1_9APHY|nr:hypothetical protein NLI96_g4955 [Physisporinus lineatus]